MFGHEESDQAANFPQNHVPQFALFAFAGKSTGRIKTLTSVYHEGQYSGLPPTMLCTRDEVQGTG